MEGLSVAGEKIDDGDVVILMLARLGVEFDSLVQNVTFSREKFTFQEVKDMMFDLETRCERLK